MLTTDCQPGKRGTNGRRREFRLSSCSMPLLLTKPFQLRDIT